MRNKFIFCQFIHLTNFNDYLNKPIYFKMFLSVCNKYMYVYCMYIYFPLLNLIQACKSQIMFCVLFTRRRQLLVSRINQHQHSVIVSCNDRSFILILARFHSKTYRAYATTMFNYNHSHFIFIFRFMHVCHYVLSIDTFQLVIFEYTCMYICLLTCGLTWYLKALLHCL